MDFSSSCKKSVCPDFDTNVPNGQWKCSLDGKSVPNTNFADDVECIFSCQSTEIHASAVIVCDDGQWKVSCSILYDSTGKFLLGCPIYVAFKCGTPKCIHG